MLDGELVILGKDGAEEFNSLQMRLHPAESRINMLSKEIPALFRAFDLLADRLRSGRQSRSPSGASGSRSSARRSPRDDLRGDPDGEDAEGPSHGSPRARA